MNINSLTREQQDLIALLNNELQAQLDDSLTSANQLGNDQQRLENLAACLANFAEVAEVMGLEGLALAWACLQRNFSCLAASDQAISAEQNLLIDSWVIYFLDYLQRLSEDALSAVAVTGLITFLAHDAWPEPLDTEQQARLGENLIHTELANFEDAANVLPRAANASMLSLNAGDDINPELFEGLMLELPAQVHNFAQQIDQFVKTKSKPALAAAQRIAHTIKGAGNVVGVTGLANFMHFSEDLLEEITRQGDEPDTDLKNLLIDMTDTLAAMLDSLLAGEAVGTQELAVMQQVLDTYHSIRTEGMSAGHKISAQVAMVTEHIHLADRSNIKTDEAAATTEPADNLSPVNLQEAIASQLRIKEETALDLLRLAGTSAIATNRLQTQVKGVKQQIQHIGQLHEKLTSLTEEFGQLIEVRELFNTRLKTISDNGLDPLELDRYNELHSFFHQLQEFTTDARDAISQTQNQLRTLEEQTYEQQVSNREAQNILLEMRMIPARSMEARFQRCVRQACRLTGKKAQFLLLGGDTMIDSRVLHDLIDPLMHLLRNAVDHGIEDVDQRIARKKLEEGTISLSFKTQGQFILIQVSDDGAGLQLNRIAAKAAELLLTPPDDNRKEMWLNQLIFMPGFSTSDHLSQTSGRGIGLDMVADRVNELKGRITIDSDAATGCTFTIRLPITMIAEHGLLIRSGVHQLVVSARGVEQLLFLNTAALTNTGEHLQYEFNNQLLDVHHVAQLARLPNTDALHAADAHALLVVESFPGQRVGVLVESVSISREMVVKPLTPFTPASAGVIGATILGDGTVASVIDIQHLVVEQLNSGIKLTTNINANSAAHLKTNQRPMALVVDDSLSTRRSLAQFVSDMGMDVCTAKDGFEAVDILQAQIPSVILVDMEMPRMNGLELTAHVRANEMTKHIPIIMITSRNTEKHRSLARAAGVDRYLNKPFSEDELLQYLQASMHT